MASVNKIHMPMVGLKYRATITTREELAEMTPMKVRFQREPENRHDPNAIAVLVSGTQKRDWHIGYIPRLEASRLAPKLDNGSVEIVGAWLTEIEPESGDAEMLVSLRKLAPKTGKVKKAHRQAK